MNRETIGLLLLTALIGVGSLAHAQEAAEAPATEETPREAATSEEATSEEATSEEATSEETAGESAPVPEATPAPEPEPEPEPEPPTETELQARRVFQRGNQAYREGDYDTAKYQFELAYRLTGEPDFLYNMANAEERTGDWNEAVISLRSYVRLSNPRDADTIEERIVNLNRRIREREEEEARELEAEREQAANIARLEAERDRRPDYGAIGLMAGGGAMLAVAIGVAAGATRIRGSAADVHCIAPDNGDTRCATAAQEDLDRAQRFAITADVLGGAALLTGTLGVVVFIRNRRARRERERLRREEAEATEAEPEPLEVDVAAGPGSVLFSLRGQF